jgi:DNA-binding MarR family transcriptional regulator
MMLACPSQCRPPESGGIAFLLTQLGTQAASEFAQALAEHDLTPPYAGIMRILQLEPGVSQQQLADRLRTAPSRVVGYVDDLEERGWIGKLAEQRGLTAGVHPGYRNL